MEDGAHLLERTPHRREHRVGRGAPALPVGGHALELRPDLQGHLAGQHEERVDVVEVDMRLGAAFAGCVAGPGHRQPVVLAEDAELASGRVGDRLTVALGRITTTPEGEESVEQLEKGTRLLLTFLATDGRRSYALVRTR